jgi:acyl carrier protein
MMKPNEISSVLIAVIKESQVLSGRSWHPLREDSRPIGALEGFDSLCGLEATTVLEEKFGCSFGDESIFVSSDGTRALTVTEISARITAALSTQ